LKFLVIGAGAIGCLVGGKLAQAGYAVTLVGRQSFAAAVQQRGLLLSDEDGQHTIAGITPTASIADAFAQRGDSYDLAIIAVKSYDTAAALDELTAAIASSAARSPAVLSLQNGVGNEETIAAVAGGAAVIAGSITTPVSVSDPGAIHVEKPSYHVYLSAWHSAVPLTTITTTQEAFSRAGFRVLVYANAQGMKWTKLLMNIMGNASSAILDMPPNELFANPMLVNIEIDAWRETLTVMRRAGFPPVNMGSYPFRLLAPLIRYTPSTFLRPFLRTRVGSARGGKMPSLHIDLHSGKLQSEIMWLNGAVARKADEFKLPAPINRMLTDSLSSLVGDERNQAAWRHNTKRFIATADEYREKETA
jgi:2-dehydropantoate 2-reductase